jgi:hypothetical protein
MSCHGFLAKRNLRQTFRGISPSDDLRYERERIQKIEFQYLNAFACFLQILARLSDRKATTEISYPQTAGSHSNRPLASLTPRKFRDALNPCPERNCWTERNFFAQTLIAHFIKVLVLNFSPLNTI